MKDIKELRSLSKLSQSDFADKYDLSVRTLQQWEQGKSKPLEALVNLIEKDIKSSSTLRNKYHHNEKKFKTVIDNKFKNIERIYPIQQRKVKELIDDISKDINVNKITIFGSSVTDAWHIGSDVDIYVDTTKSDIVSDFHDFEYDLWTNYTADNKLKNEIERKGVVVYERNKKSI